MKTIKIKLLFILLCVSSLVMGQVNVYSIKLSEGVEIQPDPVVEYKAQEIPQANSIIVFYPDIEFQEIEGIGGAFNEIGGLALMSLPESQRWKVMTNLFGKDHAHFSFCRTSVGASDFATGSYSYSEKVGDYDMEEFSVERERKSVIPYIKMAYSINPHLKMMASPWSPPGWMKYSGLMEKGLSMAEKNKLKDDPETYKAYARYFRKYIQAYREEGICIDRLVVQNEPDLDVDYPSCKMPVPQMFNFISNYLRPEFKQNNIGTEIWAGTFRSMGASLYALEFVNDSRYLEAVDGIGIQYTSPQYINDMNQLMKQKAKMHTECVCHDGSNNNLQAFSRLDEIAGYLNYGIPNFMYWNMILDHTAQSGWGWKQNSLINIDVQKGTVKYNPDYAVFYLFSKYMRPKSKRIASYSNETIISIKYKDKVRFFVKNDKTDDKTYILRQNGKNDVTVTVPSESISVIEYLL